MFPISGSRQIKVTNHFLEEENGEYKFENMNLKIRSRVRRQFAVGGSFGRSS
jgi:hypothetical protein